MTTLSLVLHSGLVLGCVALGYWLHYKFGTRISSDVDKIRQMKI